MFGRRVVSSRDCIQLSEEIFGVTKARLNPNTLRRFFGLVKTAYAPSASTIQILCNYCGFLSIDDFLNHNNAINRDLDAPEPGSMLKYLVNLFRETPVGSAKNETFSSVVKQTIVFINQYPALVDQFQSMIAKTKNGQTYYFEEFVNIDGINSNYGNGLRYYLKEKNEPEAQIFAHSLLVFRYWLTMDAPNMDWHFQQLSNVAFTASYSCSASGRYFAAMLYHGNAGAVSPSNTIMEIHGYNEGLEENDILGQIQFEMIIAEALILTGSNEEGLFYCEMAFKKMQNISVTEEWFVQHLIVLQALASCNIGNHKVAGALYSKIRPTAFSFLNKKMLTILYAFLTEKLKKNSNLAKYPAGKLIKETGYSRLRTIFNMKNQWGGSVDPG